MRPLGPVPGLEETQPLPIAALAEAASPTLRVRLRPWLSLLRFVLISVALWFAIRTVAPSYAIQGESMAPTYHDGGRVILNGAYGLGSPHHGDVVVFHPPTPSDKPYIKRVIGIEGDRVEIRDGAVYVNGARLDEPYVDGARTSCGGARHCDLTVPEDMVFVLGDNRPNSSDSRYFGPIAEDEIIGEVPFRFWPID